MTFLLLHGAPYLLFLNFRCTFHIPAGNWRCSSFYCKVQTWGHDRSLIHKPYESSRFFSVVVRAICPGLWAACLFPSNRYIEEANIWNFSELMNYCIYILNTDCQVENYAVWAVGESSNHSRFDIRFTQPHSIHSVYVYLLRIIICLYNNIYLQPLHHLDIHNPCY